MSDTKHSYEEGTTFGANGLTIRIVKVRPLERARPIKKGVVAKKKVLAESIMGDEDTGVVGGYEVALIKELTEPASIMNNKYSVGHEMYPGNEEFGKLGWAFRKKERADEAFEGS